MTSPVYQTHPADVHKILREWMLADGMPFVYDMGASKGAYLVDGITGKQYLDMFSFFASMPLGHNHRGLQDENFRSKLLQAALVKPSNSDVYTPAMADFVRTFSRTLPPGFDNLFFVEGGALAVENALKVAFDWKVRKNIAKGLVEDTPAAELGTQVIHFRGAFHGRSGYTLSLTNSHSPNKIKYFPKFKWPRVSTPGLQFPLTAERLQAVKAAEEQSLGEIRRAIAANPNDIACIIIETIQAEGGDVHFRPEFMQALRSICDESDLLLIFDEVQAGMGITGKWWAFEHLGVAPDIFCFGKKAQVCGIASNNRVNEVDSCFKVSSRINSTWGGNLVDMVRSTRYIEVIEQDRLLENAASVGAELLEHLQRLQAEHGNVVSNARGRGLMCAFDLPTPEARDEALRRILEADVLVLPCGSASLRFRPVLDFGRDELGLAMERIGRVLAQL